MVRDLEGFARSQPALFLGAAVASGFLAMRFLKSGQPEQKSGQAEGNEARYGTASRPTIPSAMPGMTSAEPAKRPAPGGSPNDSSDPRRI